MLVVGGVQVTISLLEQAMNESEKQRFLIDGFPRNEENRSQFEKQVDIYQLRPDRWLLLVYQSAQRWKRWLSDYSLGDLVCLGFADGGGAILHSLF